MTLMKRPSDTPRLHDVLARLRERVGWTHDGVSILVLGDTNILPLDTISIFLKRNTRYFDISIRYSQVYGRLSFVMPYDFVEVLFFFIKFRMGDECIKKLTCYTTSILWYSDKEHV